MRTNYKFHAIAISAICALITILYVLIGPKPVDPNAGLPPGSHSIAIYSATWGQNCNESITRVLSERQRTPGQKDENGQVIEQDKLTPVSQNNVLAAASSLCNGKLSCSILAEAESFKLDPMPGCFKKLRISYRCFSYDRLNTQDVSQGDTVTMNCAPGSTAAPSQAGTSSQGD